MFEEKPATIVVIEQKQANLSNFVRHQDLTAPRTALGLIFLGLKLRRVSGIRPFTVLSCDNIPDNGKVGPGYNLQLAVDRHRCC